jgi:ABC-type dipeptide/oligopeptide/nickel transport system permease component
VAQWIATGFAFGLIFAPRATRLVASTMTAVAGSDFLQLAYAWGQRKAEG